MKTLAFACISFLIIICCSGSAVILSKLFLDENWWPYTAMLKCVYYSYANPSEIYNITNNNGYCRNTDKSRCTYWLPACQYFTNETGNITQNPKVTQAQSRDELAFLFKLGINTYIVICILFLLALSIHFLRIVRKSGSGISNHRVSNMRLILSLNLICGFIHAIIIVTTIASFVYTYVQHEGTLFKRPLLWINICILVNTGLILMYYVYLFFSYSSASNSPIDSQNHKDTNKDTSHMVSTKKKSLSLCMNTCLGSCIGTILGKVLCTFMVLGTLVLTGYLIYYYAIRKG